MTSDIRREVVERIKLYANALHHMEGVDVNLSGAHASVAKRDSQMHYEGTHDAPEIRALITLSKAHMRRLRSTYYSMFEQYGRLLARDVLAPIARQSEQPIAWVTGNSMMPPLREIEYVEDLFALDADSDTTNATAWEILNQAIDNELTGLNVSMDAPEHDNALYVVDTSRWERKDANDEDVGDDMNDEWRPVEGA